MIRQEHFVRDEILPSWFVNRLQDRLAPLVQLRLELTNPTTVQATAGANDEASSLNIGPGNWRFNEATVTRAHPGGVAGTYLIFAVAKAQDIRDAPDPNSDFTDYAFDLRIVPNATTPGIDPGIVDIFRRVGSCAWDGAAITSITQEVGATRGAVGIVGGDLVGSLPNPTIGPFPAGRVLSWGGDTTLFRDGVATLKTGGTMKAGGGIFAAVGLAEQVYVGVGAAGVPSLILGSGLDTSLWRSGVNRISTGNVTAAEVWAQGGLKLADGLYSINGVAPGTLQLSSAGDIALLQSGVKQHWFSGVMMIFGAAGDTNLYRNAQDSLRTDDTFAAVGRVYAGHGTADQVILAPVGMGGGMVFGIALDTLLYRSAPATLKTDGGMVVGGIFTALGSSSNFFGPVHLASGVIIDWGADTSLYRSAAGVLSTPGTFTAGLALTAYEGTTARIQLGNAAGVPTLYMGLSADAIIQRVAAGRIGTGALDLSGSLKRPMLTALPGSPYDGQQILLQTAAMVAAGMRPWELRYNAAGGTYKWEVLGGASHAEEVRALQSYSASMAWENLATPGPDITVPLAGEYIIEFGAGVDMQTLSPVYRALLGVGVGGANATDADCIDAYKTEPAGVQAHRRLVTAYRKTVAAGRIRLQYRCDIGATLAFDERWLKVTPLRVG